MHVFNLFTSIFFLSPQSYFDKRLERFYQRFPNDPISKQNIAPILTHTYERALQARNMVNLFARLGICPFNNLSTSIGAYLNIVSMNIVHIYLFICLHFFTNSVILFISAR